MKIDDELNGLSPWLRELKQRRDDDGFRTPEGYFDRLEDEVFQQLDAIGARRRVAPAPQPAAWWSRLFRPRLALAFGTVLALLAAVWWWQRPTTTTTPQSDETVIVSTDLTPEEAEAYLRENAAEFDPDYLFQELKPEESVAVEPPRSTPHQPSVQSSPPNAGEELEPLLDELSDAELEDLL